MLHLFVGNHIAKLSNSIHDTPVLVGINSFLRKNKPVLLGIITKDGLSSNAENIGKLLNRKDIYFVPFSQNNPITNQTALSYSQKYIFKSIEYALEKKQIQPILI